MRNINNKYLKKTSIVFGVLMIISYMVALGLLFRTGLVPNNYMLIIVPITLIITALVALGLFRNNSGSKFRTIGLILASTGIIAGSVYLAIASASASGFINSLQDDDFTEIEYSIIAKKGSGVELKSNNNSIGYIGADTNNDAVLKEVKSRTSADPLEYSDITSIVKNLESGKTDSAVFRSSFLDLLENNSKTFYDSVVVLDKFKIRVKKDSVNSKLDTSKPYAVYISGIDTFGDVSAVSRSDVNILAVVNPNTKKILLVNTPRDYYVQLSGTTGLRDKLTHAGIYGVDTSEETLENLYGINIDKYIRINFTSLMKVVDALGGVSVKSDFDFKSGPYTFNKGVNELDGNEALAFSRNRYSFADGDRQRGKNQQKVIEGIVKKASSPQILVNYQSLLNSLNGTFQTNASGDEISSLIKQQLNSAGDWQIESISVDGVGKLAPTYSYGAQPLYVMEPDPTSLESAKLKIQEYLN